MRAIYVTTLLAGAALLAGCGSDDATSDPDVAETTGSPVALAADEAVERFDFLTDPEVDPAPADASQPALVDVRTPEEVAEGYLDGAVNLNIDDPGFRDALDELDREATYVLYCRTGNRSSQAAAIMDDLGFESVYDVGGFADLVDAGAQPAR